MPWACRFARNEVKLYMRTDQRWKHFLDDETVNALAGRQLEISGELDRRRIHLRECLRKLPAAQRTVVEEYYFNDASVERIAKSSRRSVDAIYKSLQRIRSALMDCVQQRQESTWGTES